MTYGRYQEMSPMDMRRLADLNEYLAVYFPPYDISMIYRVKAVRNKGRELLTYGNLPTLTTTGVTGYDGAGTAIPADGTISGRVYTTDGLSFKLPSTLDQNADDNNDMFYLDPAKGKRNMVYQTLIKVTPTFLRLEVNLPKQQRSFNFQHDVPGGVDKIFGFTRGFLNLAWLPGMRAGIKVGNDTNVAYFTNVTFLYREMVVEVVRDPEVVHAIISGTFQHDHLVKKVEMPITLEDASITQALYDTYFKSPTGFAGFPSFPYHKRALAIAAYQKVIANLREDV